MIPPLRSVLAARSRWLRSLAMILAPGIWLAAGPAAADFLTIDDFEDPPTLQWFVPPGSYEYHVDEPYPRSQVGGSANQRGITALNQGLFGMELTSIFVQSDGATNGTIVDFETAQPEDLNGMASISFYYAVDHAGSETELLNLIDTVGRLNTITLVVDEWTAGETRVTFRVGSVTPNPDGFVGHRTAAWGTIVHYYDSNEITVPFSDFTDNDRISWSGVTSFGLEIAPLVQIQGSPATQFPVQLLAFYAGYDINLPCAVCLPWRDGNGNPTSALGVIVPAPIPMWVVPLLFTGVACAGAFRLRRARS